MLRSCINNIGASLSEPITSETALQDTCVCMYVNRDSVHDFIVKCSLSVCVAVEASFLDRKNGCTKFCLSCSWNSRQWQILLLSMICVPWQNIKSAMHAHSGLPPDDKSFYWYIDLGCKSHTLNKRYSISNFYLGLQNLLLAKNVPPNCCDLLRSTPWLVLSWDKLSISQSSHHSLLPPLSWTSKYTIVKQTNQNCGKPVVCWFQYYVDNQLASFPGSFLTHRQPGYETSGHQPKL